jgi:hypothetical protein
VLLSINSRVCTYCRVNGGFVCAPMWTSCLPLTRPAANVPSTDPQPFLSLSSDRFRALDFLAHFFAVKMHLMARSLYSFFLWSIQWTPLLKGPAGSLLFHSVVWFPAWPEEAHLGTSIQSPYACNRWLRELSNPGKPNRSKNLFGWCPAPDKVAWRDVGSNPRRSFAGWPALCLGCFQPNSP